MGNTAQWRANQSKVRPLSKAFVVGLILTLTSFIPTHSFGAFQEALWGARPTGLVGAYTALADDSNAPVYNPAGISLMADNEFTITYAQLYSGVNFFAGENDTSRLGLGYVSFVPNVLDKRYGSFAVSWTNFKATNVLQEDSFTLTYADSYEFPSNNGSPVFSYGVNLKLLRRSFTTDVRTDADPVFNAGNDSDAVTGDIGFMYRPHLSFFPGLKFGISAQNITEPDIGLSQTDRVPARYNFGMAYQDRQLRWLNPAIEVSKRDDRTLISAAYEGWFVGDSLAFRAGGNEDQLGGGLGYQFRVGQSFVIRLDYAILWPLNVEGTNGSHRVSFTTNF